MTRRTKTNLLDHIHEFGFRGVLSQGSHHSSKLLGCDGAWRRQKRAGYTGENDGPKDIFPATARTRRLRGVISLIQRSFHGRIRPTATLGPHFEFRGLTSPRQSPMTPQDMTPWRRRIQNKASQEARRPHHTGNLPSPSLSKRLKASLNSAICSSVNWSAMVANE